MKKIFACFLCVITMLLTSCTAFKYGTSTTVQIESQGGSDTGVNIVAVGKKKTEEYKNVTLPFKMKVKHNNLPLRVSVESPNNLYPFFSINGKETYYGTDEYVVGKVLGVMSSIGGGVLLGLNAIWLGGTTLCFALGGAELGLGGLCLGMSALSVPYIPEKKNYIIDPNPITATNSFLSTSAWKQYKDLYDIYDLLSNDEYELAKYKSTYMMTKQETGELYYLRGVSSYELGKYKDAVKDLRHALACMDISESMKKNVWKYIDAAENKKKEQARDRRNMWKAALGSAIQTTSAALQYSQMRSSVGGNGASVGSGNMDYLLDPNYAIQQVQQQNWTEYLIDTNGGQTMSYEDWYMNVKMPSIQTSNQSGSTTGGSSSGTQTSSSPSSSSSGKSCHLCHGLGKCWTCNGKRYYLNEMTGKNISCPNCKDGLCSHCHGSGKE